MSFRTLLTVTAPDLGDGDLGIAAELCRQTEAHLSVLVISPAVPAPVSEYALIASDVWVGQSQEELAMLRTRTDAIARKLPDISRSADVASAYGALAELADAVGRRARYADLTLIGPDLFADDLKDVVVEGALFASGRPLLAVPKGAVPTLSPRRVMVAWDAGIEASRAVREALDILVGAEEVHVVLVDPVEGEGAHGAEPGADVATWLSRHGAKVVVERLPSAGHSVAEVLHRHAVDRAADLLVMGAYGHSRLRERIFGGVTRSMIREAAIPILMAR